LEIEKTFGKNGKRPPSTIGIPLATEGTTKLGKTKTTMERTSPTYDL